MACAALKRPHNFDLLAGNSPEQLSGSPKRRRCGAVATSASPSSTISPFLEATPRICRDELSRNVHDEWRRLQRRRRLTCPPSPPNNSSNQPASNMQSTTSTSALSSFGSHYNFHSPLRGSMSPTGSMSPPRGKDQPTLSVKQVVLLCERLWKEREEKLREEYDHVLNDRLSEQYDSFLKFTQDQIMRKFQQSACSYVS